MAGLYAVQPGSRRGLILAPSIPGGFGIAAPGPARRGHPLRPGPGLPKRLPKPPKAPNPTTAGVLKAWCLLHRPTSSDGGSDVSCLTAPLPARHPKICTCRGCQCQERPARLLLVVFFFFACTAFALMAGQQASCRPFSPSKRSFGLSFNLQSSGMSIKSAARCV